MVTDTKSKINYVLDETDEKVVHLFAQLGMPKNLAKTLIYISQVDECSSIEIEQGTDLRQPELSISMKELRRKKCVLKRDRKKDGKGRPIHLYKLAKPLNKIVDSFEKEKQLDVKTVEKNLNELKKIIIS
jgi:predicted transcriptional regulator